jgi:nucleobase:cation symporter-1, NCS1 family
MTNREQPGRLESHTIQPIGAEHRHGTARDLFTVWFGSNITLLALVTGALATTVYNLSFTWALLSILFGNLFGGVFMALHSAQGATLGVPQMVQTRGQFGSLGALLVVGIVIVMYVGFFASNAVLGGQALHLIVPRMSDTSGILWIGALSLVATIVGHDLIHAYTRLLTYAAGSVLALAFFWIVFIHGLPPDFMSRNSVSVPGVLSTVSIAALWQIAYAPYVSDYSRYLPLDTGPRTAFWASYWGCTLGSIIPMILGAGVGIYSKGGDVIESLAALTGGISSLVLIVFTIGLAAANAMNLYCCTLSTLTCGQTLVAAWSPKAIARTVVALILFGCSLILALLTKGSFLVDYTDFILLLLYVLVPWTAINLVDYYLIQHGRYDVQSFMRPDGGIYGRVNVAAVTCYVLGIVVQLPFMSTTRYTGFVAAALKGSDLSWIVGLVVTAPIYYFWARGNVTRVQGHRAQPAASRNGVL